MGRDTRRHAFINEGRATTLRAAVFRNTLLNRPNTQRALLRRAFALNTQMRKGTITEQQAVERLEQFDLLLRKFSRDLHTKINNDVIPQLPKIQQEDLSLTVNITLALQNPDSYASQLMNGVQGDLIEALNKETTDDIKKNNLDAQEIEQEVEQVYQETQKEAETQQYQAENPPETASEEVKSLMQEVAGTLVKATPLVIAIVAIEERSVEETRDIVENTFNRYTQGHAHFAEAVLDADKALRHELKPTAGLLEDKDDRG